jgi:hypothetical protein
MPRFTDSSDPLDPGHRGHPTYAVDGGKVTPVGNATDPGARSGKPNDKQRIVPHSWGMTREQSFHAGAGGRGAGTQQSGGGHVLPSDANPMSSAYLTEPRPYVGTLKQHPGMRSRFNDAPAGGAVGENAKRAPALDLTAMAAAVKADALGGSDVQTRMAHGVLPDKVQEN